MRIDLSNTVFVFDLDDTLYKEADYHASGVEAVASMLSNIYKIDVLDYLKLQISAGVQDIWGAICRDWDLPATLKDSLIWEYRLHQPNIKLKSCVKDLIYSLEKKSAGVAILTDGRSSTQRLKINALGLSHLPVFISDEHGEIKPDPLRFKLIEEMFPDKKYIYIGDNLAKDFLAPNSLGWKTICLKNDGRNIHPQDVSEVANEYLPVFWLTNLEELKEYLC